jgi:UDP-N-acetylglucosamine 2-epimerase (non-hydrolysing)
MPAGIFSQRGATLHFSMYTRPIIGVVFGTRPEAIKLAPVIFELKSHPDEFETVLISTAQHRQMLDQVLSVFGIEPDIDLNLMTHNQPLSGIAARVLQEIDSVLASRRVDLLMVQGDTTTAFAAALAAFFRKIPVAHVEAGLRSRDLANPFPEEANRRLASVVTRLHFDPTAHACENLLGEGVPPEDIFVTGNTVVDAARMLVERGVADQGLPPGIPDDNSRLILMTSHRRESWGPELENICLAVRDLVEQYRDVRVVYPVHLNPNVRGTVNALLQGVDRVHLTEPMDYFGFLSVLRRSYLVLTDSGGVQEEAPTFGKPVLVLRKVTERPEASMRGLSVIVGTSRERIVEEASRLLSDSAVYRRMSEATSPFGDGRASARIGKALSRWFAGVRPALDEFEQFDVAPELAQTAMN